MDAIQFFSGSCLLCRARTTTYVCKGCEADLLFPEYMRCLVCAAQTTSTTLVCGECVAGGPSFDITEVLYSYRFPVDRIIKTGKYEDKPELIAHLADKLSDKLMQRITSMPDALVPVPLHPARLRDRGFNQSLIIAKRIAAKLHLPVIDTAMARVVDRPPQSALNGTARQRNIRGVFKSKQKTDVQHIAIVDDVITTGATANELALVLRKAGCVEIEVWAIARTEH